jgi:hypothetical protein
MLRRFPSWVVVGAVLVLALQYGTPVVAAPGDADQNPLAGIK